MLFRVQMMCRSRVCLLGLLAFSGECWAAQTEQAPFSEPTIPLCAMTCMRKTDIVGGSSSVALVATEASAVRGDLEMSDVSLRCAADVLQYLEAKLQFQKKFMRKTLNPEVLGEVKALSRKSFGLTRKSLRTVAQRIRKVIVSLGKPGRPRRSRTAARTSRFLTLQKSKAGKIVSEKSTKVADTNALLTELFESDFSGRVSCASIRAGIKLGKVLGWTRGCYSLMKSCNEEQCPESAIEHFATDRNLIQIVTSFIEPFSEIIA